MQLKLVKMKIEIINEKKNPIFNRKEIILEVESEITPSHIEAEKIVAEKFKTTPEFLKIKRFMETLVQRPLLLTQIFILQKRKKENIEAKSKKEKEANKKIAEESKKAEEKK